jgi:hypothetical protein
LNPDSSVVQLAGSRNTDCSIRVPALIIAYALLVDPVAEGTEKEAIKIKKVKLSYAENIWGTGGIYPRILDLGTICRSVVSYSLLPL